MTRHLWQIVSIFLISVWMGASLFHAGWFVSHDGIFHARRAAEMVEMFKTGGFPVRYAASLDNNFGIPLFNYIYPGPYYLAALPNLLFGIGLPTILKLMMFAALLGGPLAWYLYFRQRPAVAVAVSLVSLFTPYLLVNVYVRGALGETITLALLPWALLMQKELSRSGRLRWYSPLPLFLALICHNFLGYLALPLLFLDLLLRHKHVLLGLINTTVSVGLASFFWLPMYFERHLLLSGLSNNFSFPYADHFVAWSQFLMSPWGYGYSMPGIANDGFTFQLGYVPLLGLALALILSLYHHKNTLAKQTLVYLACLLLVVFAMTPASLRLWDLIAALAAMQFPWRLLGLVAVLAPLTIGTGLMLLKSERKIYLLSIILCAVGIITTYTYRTPKQLLSSSEFAEAYAFWQNGTTTSYRAEIAPRWSPVEHDPAPLIPAIDGGEIRDYTVKPLEITFHATTKGSTKVIIPKNYFPTWTAQMDGQTVDIAPSDTGTIIMPLAPGDHDYRLVYKSTKIEKMANLISLLSLALLLYVLYKNKQSSPVSK